MRTCQDIELCTKVTPSFLTLHDEAYIVYAKFITLYREMGTPTHQRLSGAHEMGHLKRFEHEKRKKMEESLCHPHSCPKSQNDIYIFTNLYIFASITDGITCPYYY